MLPAGEMGEITPVRKKLEAKKTLVNRAESPASGAALLGGVFGNRHYKNNDTAQYISNKANIGFTMFE